MIDYTPKIIGDESLKKMNAVIEDLQNKFSMHQDFPDMYLGHPKAIDGVSVDDYEFILNILFQHGCLSRDHYDKETGYHISLGNYYNEFNRLIWDEVKRRKLLSTKTKFDDKKSILFLNGQEIKIAKQNKNTIAHRILKHIFDKDDLEELSSYVEIEGEEYHPELKLGKKYHAACQDIQKKIEEQTKIKDFLNFSSSDKGEVSVNKKYL